MSDLFTHYAAARVPASFLRDRRLQALLLLGTFLPDLVSKSLYWIARAPEDFDTPSHSLVGLLPLCYLAALFVEAGLRRAAFAALYLGAAVHVALDLLKDNQGSGSAILLHPFSTAGVELGWIEPQDVIYLAPFAAVLLLILHWKERRVR